MLSYFIFLGLLVLCHGNQEEARRAREERELKETKRLFEQVRTYTIKPFLNLNFTKFCDDSFYIDLFRERLRGPDVPKFSCHPALEEQRDLCLRGQMYMDRIKRETLIIGYAHQFTDQVPEKDKNCLVHFVYFQCIVIRHYYEEICRPRPCTPESNC